MPVKFQVQGSFLSPADFRWRALKLHDEKGKLPGTLEPIKQSSLVLSHQKGDQFYARQHLEEEQIIASNRVIFMLCQNGLVVAMALSRFNLITTAIPIQSSKNSHSKAMKPMGLLPPQ